MPINVVLLGFGTVGESVYRTLKSHQDELREIIGCDIHVKGVLVKDDQKIRKIDQGVLVTTSFEELSQLPNIDVAIEAIVGVEPAYTYAKVFLNKGIPVLTANKEMAAHKGAQLKKISEYSGVEFLFEATVGGGIPIIGVLKHLLHANRISKIEGILNGTSNFILSTMRNEHASFQEALELAQAKGYAEADPSNDILGRDSFYKIMILSELVFGFQPDWKKIKCEGINAITSQQITEAGSGNGRIKLIAVVEKDSKGHISASVKPVTVKDDHPLYNVEGVDNAVLIHTDLLGELLLKGPGAGGLPTASAILEDLTVLFQGRRNAESRKTSIIKKASPFY